MSVLTYIASNYPVPEKRYPADLKVNFNLDTGVIDDGGLDDSFELIPCMNYDGVFTEKKYAMALEWHYYTEGRAGQVIQIIKENLCHTNEVEFCHLWMSGCEKPIIRTKTISLDELTPEKLREWLENDVTEEFYDIPIQYRLVITAK